MKRSEFSKCNVSSGLSGSCKYRGGEDLWGYSCTTSQNKYTNNTSLRPLLSLFLSRKSIRNVNKSYQISVVEPFKSDNLQKHLLQRGKMSNCKGKHACQGPVWQSARLWHMMLFIFSLLDNGAGLALCNNNTILSLLHNGRYVTQVHFTGLHWSPHSLTNLLLQSERCQLSLARLMKMMSNY